MTNPTPEALNDHDVVPVAGNQVSGVSQMLPLQYLLSLRMIRISTSCRPDSASLAEPSMAGTDWIQPALAGVVTEEVGAVLSKVKFSPAPAVSV